MPGRDLAQDPGGPQLVDHAGRNPEPACDPLDSRRIGAGGTQSREQPIDALLHLGLEPGARIGQPHAPPAAQQAAI